MYKKYCRVIEIRELIHRKMELVWMSELRYRLEEMTYRMTTISGMMTGEKDDRNEDKDSKDRNGIREVADTDGLYHPIGLFGVAESKKC